MSSLTWVWQQCLQIAPQRLICVACTFARCCDVAPYCFFKVREKVIRRALRLPGPPVRDRIRCSVRWITHSHWVHALGIWRRACRAIDFTWCINPAHNVSASCNCLSWCGNTLPVKIKVIYRDLWFYEELEHPWDLSNAEKLVYSRKSFFRFFFYVLQNSYFWNCSLKAFWLSKYG